MATYFVKSTGGTGSGADDANAWSLAKLNSTALASGDIVQFKSGDTIYGQLTVNMSGLNKPATFTSYSTGSSPVISGFTQLTSWTLFTGSIYFATLSSTSSINMVTLDGNVKAMGRYPNSGSGTGSGYLTYATHSNNTALIDASVGSIPFDPSGSEVVIRKQRWILDRHPVTSRVGNTLNYSVNSNWGNNNIYSPFDGNGYFIQNHIGTLDQDGDWYFNSGSNKFYMFFTGGTPTTRIVKVSTQDRTLYLNFWNSASFSNITFEGANQYGAYVIGTGNINFTNCAFRQHGGFGVWGSFLNGLIVSSSTFTDILSSGINGEQNVNSASINGNTFTNIATIPGAGKSGDGTYEGCAVSGDWTIIINNTVKSIGFNGINFQGNNILVQNNYVDTYGFVKDDAGGIYSYNASASFGSVVSRSVVDNIIVNGVGAFSGAGAFWYEAFGKAGGIYLDDYSSNTTVVSNSIATGGWGGIVLHRNQNSFVIANVVTNFQQQLLILPESGSPTTGLLIKDNKFLASGSGQTAMYISQPASSSITGMGVFSRNYYGLIGSNLTIGINQNYSGGNGEHFYTLSQWKISSSLDSGSLSNIKILTSGSKVLSLGGRPWVTTQ